MRSSYRAADDMDFYPMDQFQKEQFLLIINLFAAARWVVMSITLHCDYGFVLWPMCGTALADVPAKLVCLELPETFSEFT